MREIELKNVVAINSRKYLISTISMKVRHSYFQDDKDLVIYETMIFELKDDKVEYANPIYNERYNTADEAIYEHGKLVQNPEIVFLNQKCKIN
ncbi:MAG: hypothetical protein LBG67_00630 [Campylobacteraceae bacterium]|nr:hypothetical protein [Campylobacteraceae bacterium]